MNITEKINLTGIMTRKYFLFFVVLILISHSKVYAENYFWVGGNGNWSDINHWATSSGGVVLHSQVPTPVDDVFFDINSFDGSSQIITINQKNAVCRNMDWSGSLNTPKLYGSDTSSIRIYGDLNFISEMHQNYNGEVIFESVSTGKVIKTAGHNFLSHVRFLGIGGGWHLLDNFNTAKNIYFINGSLNTNGFEINCNDFISTEPSTRKIILSNSLLNIKSWQIDGQNLNLQASLAVFNIEQLLSNNNGTHLLYGNIYFDGASGEVINTNVYTTYNNIEFILDGSISGDCKINNVIINGVGNITDNDSINNVTFTGGGSISGGHHVISTFKSFGSSSIEGNNKISTALFYDESIVSGTNHIDSAYFFKEGIVAETNQIRKLLISHFGIIEGSNNIGNAIMYGDGNLTGSNTFKTLTLSPGNTYTFSIEDTQTIENNLIIIGDCYKPIRMLSDTNGVEAIIKCNTPVFGNYLSLRDIKAEGNTPFKATNSVDLGNNTNWDIETTTGLNLFWVNGIGKWDDPNHWDFISGGPGGHCPPTEIDNVFFDGNSFSSSGQIVTINVKNAVCHDMKWENTNGGLLMGVDTNNIRIFGSLTLNPQMQWLFLGQTYFEAIEKGKTITNAGNTFKNNNWFNGRGGSWILIDNMETFGDILFQQGDIYTLGNDITCGIFSSTDTTTRKLFLSNSTVIMTKGGQKVWNFNAINLELHADSSLLISLLPDSDINSFGNHQLIYNNVEFYGESSRLLNSIYCNYNLVTFYDSLGIVKGNCTIDTVSFHEVKGTVLNSDTIKTAIFFKKDGSLYGEQHNIEIVYFYDDGKISGNNNIDTTLFYKNAIIIGQNNIDTCIVFNRSIIQGNNNIKTATLLGDGNFNGENLFHNLTLSKSNSYYLENGKTQTVKDNLKIDGACTGPIIIQSDKNQSQATIKKEVGTVEANYVFLRDINAAGTNIPYIAYNSIDMGNNTNWTIQLSNPKELYWVNGNGHWSDSLHWSESSGGIGGSCIPSPIDNVYFDENSFNDINDSVKTDVGNATCHNMNWSGARFHPTFASPDTNNIRIFGSLVLNNNMNLRTNGSIYFESTHEENIINCKGNKFLYNIYFQGFGGQWKLNNMLKTDSTIYFSNGEIITQGNTIECESFNSDFTNNRMLNFDESVIILNGSAVEVWFVNGINFVMSATNSIVKCKNNNAIIRNDYGGPFNFNDILAEGNHCRIYNKDAQVEFRKINFMGNGQIHGDCKIDSLSFIGSGSIFDSDIINYLNVNGDLGYIDGVHKIKIAQFWNESNIFGQNIFDSILTIASSTIYGNNIINNYLQVGDNAIIEGENFINEAKLLGNGHISGENTFNILTFSPGNKYELEDNHTQFINNEFNIRGNNCFPIILHSQNNGYQANIHTPSGLIVSGDFIEMRDINATGGSEFYAGKFSTDISNNSGWSFNNSPGYIFGFPIDTTMCSGNELKIGTENFNTDENSTFLWQNGSTSPDFYVTYQDSLWVTVNYAFNCSYTDTILIRRSPSPELNLGDDRIICEGDSISIVSSSDNLSYLWSDNSIDSTFIAYNSGTISLKVTALNGCSSSDSIQVFTKPKPDVFLGNDTILQYDETIQLDAQNIGASYFWSTGDTIQSITVSGNDKLIWVYVNYDGCVGNDSILLNEYPKCILAVPNAFSPNGDGQNDILFVRGNGFNEFELLIFNRIGEMVFNTTDESVGWDGTFKGKAQEVDAYMYILKGRCTDGQDIFYKGNITLLR